MDNFKIVRLLCGVLIFTFFYQCDIKKEEKSEVQPVAVPAATNVTEYYPSKKVKTQGQLVGNKKTGEWISYYENGEVQSIKTYNAGELDGYQKMDYSQVLYMEGYSKQGQRVGTWKSYFKENNQLKYVKHFDDSGNATGQWEHYYDSGELHRIENYTNNKVNGEVIEYFKNGKIYTIGSKRNSVKIGTWKIYNDQGQLLQTQSYNQK